MRTNLTLAGAALASLLFALPALAQNQNPGSQQAAPSPKPASQAKTEAVAPGAVGAKQEPGQRVVGNEQAAPSPIPAPQATTGAVEAKPQEKNPSSK